MVRPERFELPTYCSGGNRSIQLSYGRALLMILRASLPPRFQSETPATHCSDDANNAPRISVRKPHRVMWGCGAGPALRSLTIVEVEAGLAVLVAEGFVESKLAVRLIEGH
jgi:hypothetical protein